jgi:hypothetical protein
MNPNTIPVQDMRIQGMPAQPARAPAAPMPQQAPMAAPQQQRGLLGGFLGPDGRDARARLAIALEGLTMNPNQALVGELQRGIQSRETAAQKNATVEWLRSRGRDDLAAAIGGGLPAADALRIATDPGAGAERGVVVGGNVVNPLTGEVIYQGPAQTAPDMTPAAFKALDLQAQAAGYAPGTPEYQEFMATRGAGLVAEAKAVGAARGETAAGAGAKAALASQIELQVNDLLTDPYLPEMVGPMASRLPNVTADAARVQSKMDQILGGAFLQARQLLKGGGAITDFESQKAEQAFIRMNAAQNEADFRKAMTDFRDAVTAGLPKLDSAETAAPPAGGNRIRYDENGNRIE